VRDVQELIGAVGALSAKERKALARMLKEKGIDLFAVAPVFKRDPQAPLRLSYAQQRQWFLWQLDPHSAAYNIPTALRLQGELDHGALQAAFDALLARHGALRTGFVEDQDQVLQFIREPQPFALPLQTLQPGEAPQARIEQLLGQCLSQPFDLRREPLLRAALLRTGEREHVLALAMHHIVPTAGRC
jgi:hypothetical protein